MPKIPEKGILHTHSLHGIEQVDNQAVFFSCMCVCGVMLFVPLLSLNEARHLSSFLPSVWIVAAWTESTPQVWPLMTAVRYLLVFQCPFVSLSTQTDPPRKPP